MKKKTVKKKAAKKAIKKPSYETLERKIRQLKKQSDNSQSATLRAKAYDLFKEVHGSNGNIVQAVNTIVQDSVDQLWSQIRMKVINYGGPL